jgi:hypothetical protein
MYPERGNNMIKAKTVFKSLTTLVLGIALVSVPAGAHHTWVVQYDRNDVIILEGKISKIQLTSPHSRIFVEIEGESGEPEIWAGETWPLGTLYRRGLTHESIAVGDVVRLTGERATKGRKGLHLRSIYRPSDGYRVWIGLRTDTGENSVDGMGEGINNIQLEDDSA